MAAIWKREARWSDCIGSSTGSTWFTICDVLGISDSNRAMTQGRFYNLVSTSKKISKDANRKLIEHGGFVYVQSDLELH